MITIFELDTLNKKDQQEAINLLLKRNGFTEDYLVDILIKSSRPNLSIDAILRAMKIYILS